MGKILRSLVVLFLLCVMVACGSDISGEDKKEIERADKAIYDFIVAQVEGDHALFKQVLIEDAQGILKDDYHAHKGAAEEMGERYEIKRYDNHFDEGNLYYYIKFYRPFNDEMDYRNVLMIQDEDGNWKSTEMMGIKRDKMREAMGDEEPITVHEMEGDEDSE